MTCPHLANYEQSIRNRGTWLQKNETALRACQSFLVSKFWETYECEENSGDLDQFLLEIEDHIVLLAQVVADLRHQEFWPKPDAASDEPTPETSAPSS